MQEQSASEQIDAIIEKNAGWKGKLVSEIRAVILASDSNAVEEVKWKMRTRPEGLAVWSHDGIVCFVEIWKDNIKLLFPKGAVLADIDTLFNARLKSKDIRAIEFHEGDTIPTEPLTQLYLRAVQHNSAR